MLDFQNNEMKEFGDFVENEILELIKIKHPLAFNDNVNGMKNKKWDLVIPNINCKIEVKSDYKSIHTGNILVEVFGYDGDSGLTTTEADFWVFVTGFRKIWITPLEIYRFIETHPKSHKGREIIVGSGDNYTKKVYKLIQDDLLLYIYSFSNKKRGHVEMITSKNDPLYWFNCLIYNDELNNYIDEAKIMESKLNFYD